MLDLILKLNSKSFCDMNIYFCLFNSSPRLTPETMRKKNQNKDAYRCLLLKKFFYGIQEEPLIIVSGLIKYSCNKKLKKNSNSNVKRSSIN